MAVRTKTINPAAALGGDAAIEDDLSAKGVNWEFLNEVTPAAFDTDKSLHNQARFQPLDTARVESYAEAMAEGVEFPPVLATGKAGKYVIVDGNHRLQAALKAKRSLKAYILTADPQTVVLLTFQANAKHGLPTSEDERVAQALYLVDAGATSKKAAVALAVPERLIASAMRRRVADDRFREAKIPSLTVERINVANRRRLAMITTDEGFVAAVDLVSRADMPAGEVSDLVTQLNELRSSAKQVEFVHEMSKALQGYVQESGGGLLRKGLTRTPKSRLSQALTTIDNLPEDLALTAEGFVGPEREAARVRVRETVKRLNAFARLLDG